MKYPILLLVIIASFTLQVPALAQQEVVDTATFQKIRVADFRPELLPRKNPVKQKFVFDGL